MVLMRTGEIVKVGVVNSTADDILEESVGIREIRKELGSLFCASELEAMVHRRNHTRRHRGAGYLTSSQFFNPEELQRHTDAPAVSTAPTDLMIRPVLNSTFKVGGKRRRLRGGFSPSIMGPFLQNAQQAIVPLALYSAYHLMPKKGRNVFSLRSRRSSRPRRNSATRRH